MAIPELPDGGLPNLFGAPWEKANPYNDLRDAGEKLSHARDFFQVLFQNSKGDTPRAREIAVAIEDAVRATRKSFQMLEESQLYMKKGGGIGLRKFPPKFG